MTPKDPSASRKTNATIESVSIEAPATHDTTQVKGNRSPQSLNPSPTTKKRARSDDLNKVPPNKKSKSAPASPAPEHRGLSSDNQAVTTNNINKTTWQGFCEIESDAAFFSVMLREMGVTDVTVKEVYTVDPNSLKQDLPQPIYGIVLCYRYREFDNDKQEEDCPDLVWFANQLPAQNSCATLALINILMNQRDISLGDNLSEFQNFTQDLSPFQRSEALASFKFVKKIHNSFAKKMDMQEADTLLARKANKDFKSRRSSASTNSSQNSIEENAHHFIAFLPIKDKVWKLDGMDQNPTSMGHFNAKADRDWLRIAGERIQALMIAAADHDYTILALCQSPVARHRREFCTIAEACRFVEARLDEANEDWRSFVAEGGVPMTPSLLQSLGVSDSQLQEVALSDGVRKEIEGMGLESLLVRRESVAQQQKELADNIFSALAEEQEEEDKATERRWDYGPAIRLWLEKLASSGYLEANLARFK